MMVVLRSKKRKDDCQFPRYKRWLPLEKFFLALMLIAFVAQFCVVLPRDAPFTHTSLMKGGFKTLQPSIKQTTHEFKDTVSALQPPAAKSSDVTYIMNNVLRHLTKSPSTKPIRSDVNDGLLPPMKPLVTKQMRDDVPDGLRLLTKQPGTKQIIGNGHVDLRPPTRSPDIIQARGDVRNALRPSTRLTQSPNHQSHQTSVQLRSVISQQQTTDFQRTHARNYNRQLHLRDQCKLLSQNQTSYRNAYMKRDILRILTSSTLALVYCRVNKAASWYTISILRNVLDCNEDCMRRYSQRIRSLSYAKKKNQIKNSFKFLFVREPYGRLFSTYCNKFYLPKGIWDPIGKDIVRRYRKNPSEDSLKYGYDVTFGGILRVSINVVIIAECQNSVEDFRVLSCEEAKKRW
ncbi:uncharacterized protein LOC132716457 [Ruditapes philippinarum]|uniref:uncharacterized protein LOC132716457 n=1 Tax=Ruditapes philippinarum TaxID=129788 RepID=UPI00295B5142|nr:uncharacterized protein LOC132716457 [Ruditapes philippinarum]